MASKSVICCVITILLVNTNAVFPLDLPESLERFQRAILSENPTEELNNIINQDLSRASVYSYVKTLIPESVENLRRLSASEDLLQILVTKYAEDPRIKEVASNDDVQSILDVLNYDIEGTVLVINDSMIVVDVDALAGVLRNHTTIYLQELYPDNIYMQIIAGAIADEQVTLLSRNLKSILANEGISVEIIGEIVSLISNSYRAKRDIVTDGILVILRTLLAAFLGPIQTEFNNTIVELLADILSFYVPCEQTNSIYAVITSFINTGVVRIAEVVVVFQTDVNNLFNNVINGTIVISSRRRRDADLEFENFYDFDSVALEISHRRVTRDIVSDIFTAVTNPLSLIFSSVVSPITNIVNAIVKNIFITILSSQYEAIGSLVTLPLRFIVNTVIDTILPCTDCTSIV